MTELNDQAKEARRAYYREWAKKNRDRVKAANERYWLKKAKEAAEHNVGQQPASKEEAEERMKDLRTQGRKGCKALRINMAFTPENYDFIHTMAKASGMTMTKYVNHVFEGFRKLNQGAYIAARDMASEGIWEELG